MKLRLLTVFSVGIGFILAYGNTLLLCHNNPVNVYSSAFATLPEQIIQQDDSLERYYYFDVIDDSLFRFKVRIFEIGWTNERSDKATVGWIDKINTTVIVRARAYDPDGNRFDGGPFITLYESPTKDSKFIRYNKGDFVDIDAFVDKIYGDWYHINFVENDTLFSGWTTEYCTNPFGACH